MVRRMRSLPSRCLTGETSNTEPYASALSRALLHCTKIADAEKTLITSLARAKGLPQRVGEAQAAKFFAQRPS